MYKTSVDFTNTFRILSQFNPFNTDNYLILNQIMQQTNTNNKNICPILNKNLWTKWLATYAQRIKNDINNNSIDQYMYVHVQLMNDNNPKIILRNHLIQNAIQKAERGDYSEIEKLHQILKDPYDKHKTSNNVDRSYTSTGSTKVILSCSS